MSHVTVATSSSSVSLRYSASGVVCFERRQNRLIFKRLRSSCGIVECGARRVDGSEVIKEEEEECEQQKQRERRGGPAERTAGRPDGAPREGRRTKPPKLDRYGY
ncbi:hypothetical protein AB1Y20_010988 [Prymnesium parvum]|uniref:Uncharacterized protein n=1 Tax=Prymnesium parvum TaxID=97485 RepID=A0AB34IMR3_PRYPA